MDNYEVIHRLGKGGCAAVYLVRHKESRKLFAMKKIELDERKKTRTKVAVEKEARILSQLKHPHIVLYHESYFDSSDEYLNIIQDYCDGGSLDDKIKAAAGKASYFEEMQIMEWFIQIIMAVQYFHSKKILHRDLKAENVFLTRKNVVKIGDFGISKVLENTIDVAQTIVGTPSYLSPELCKDIPYSSKSDIWAVGCLLYEMCALRPPFDAQNLISLFFKIIKGDFEPIPSRYSSELQDLVKTVLVKTPDDRPSASAILNIHIVKTHLALFIQQKENLLQQKTSNDNSVSSSQTTPISSAKTTPKSEKPVESSSPALRRNTVRLASTTLTRRSQIHSGETIETTGGKSPSKQDSGLGISSETELPKEMRLEVPKHDQDTSSDYSDDFDESSASEADDEDIKEEIEESVDSESDIEDETEVEKGEGQDDVEYADDFEEYDYSEDLDQMVSQAREAQDIEAVDDWFADSLSEMHLEHTKLLQQQCKEALGGRGLREVGRMVNEGTLTEEDLRPKLRLKGSTVDDDAEICHFDLNDLDSG